MKNTERENLIIDSYYIKGYSDGFYDFTNEVFIEQMEYEKWTKEQIEKYCFGFQKGKISKHYASCAQEDDPTDYFTKGLFAHFGLAIIENYFKAIKSNLGKP